MTIASTSQPASAKQHIFTSITVKCLIMIRISNLKVLQKALSKYQPITWSQRTESWQFAQVS